MDNAAWYAPRSQARLISGRICVMGDRGVEPPDYEQLVTELKTVRERGIVHLRDLDLPALGQACRATGHAEPDAPLNAPMIEGLLRAAVEANIPNRVGNAAALLFGLEPGTRGDSPAQLRLLAAEDWGVSAERFRREPQALILSQIADTILGFAHAHHQRLSHLNLERRLPPTSRLALSWLERFEAYYRIWTPVAALAGDLTAYRSTLLDPDRPYDLDPDDDPAQHGYSQETQAAGYLTFALWHYTAFLVCLHQFSVRHGGLWLLSDERAEQDAANAIYRIGWHTPNNERDDSYLRDLHDLAGGEMHPFLNLLQAEPIGRTTHDEWLDWAATCRCSWNPADSATSEHYPTHRHHPGIDRNCQLHAVVTACGDYCALIDDDWHRIADWYHLPTQRLQPVDAERLYEDWRHDPGTSSNEPG